MTKIKTIITFSILAALSSISISCSTNKKIKTVVEKSELSTLKAEAQLLMKGFGKSLKNELIKANKAGGPLAAINACQAKAPLLAHKASTRGWRVARTSLKLRSPANQPSAYETAVMEKFEKQLASGKKIQSLTHAEIVEFKGSKTFHFIKAIKTKPMCLSCHGAPNGKLKKTLTALYPNDKAIGFKTGDIRGVFTIYKKLDTK